MAIDKSYLLGAWSDAQRTRFDVHGGVTSVTPQYAVDPAAPATTITADPGLRLPGQDGPGG